MAQQTAVEWFFENINDETIKDEYYYMYQRAKQMEKEQIIEDFINGSQWSIFHDDTPIDKIAEQYYNETYGK